MHTVMHFSFIFKGTSENVKLYNSWDFNFMLQKNLYKLQSTDTPIL